MDDKKVIEILKQESIHGFIKFNKMETEKGDIITWDKHQFLLDIYDDWSPIMACCKSSQIGFSTMAIFKTLYAAKYKRFNIIYTLPTSGDVNEFVSSKVNKIIENNELLTSLVKDKDTIFQKQLGDAVVFFKGTASGKAKEKKSEASTGIMITSDLNIHDEADRSDQVIMEQFESRLDFSEYKGRWYFSNPTVPGVGAHKWYLKSDQKHWFHQCSRCKHWFYLDWTDKMVDRKNKCYRCPKCKGILSDEDRSKGRWIAKYKDRKISGYWINQMMASWKSCEELLEKEESSSKAFFMNFVLGLPYIGSDIVVNRKTIVSNIVLTKNKEKNCVMGVDNGIEKHYVIGNSEGIFMVGKTTDWDEIERLRNKFDAVMVIDALPYPNKPKELTKKYKHKVYVNYYKRDKDDLGVIRFQRKDKSGVVYSDRNKLFDQVIDEMYKGAVTFNLTENALEEYIAHWESLYLAEVDDSMGIKRTQWDSSNGVDHYCHATLYWYIAMDRLKSAGGSIVDVNPKHETEEGVAMKEGKMIDPKSGLEYIYEEQNKNVYDN